MLGHSRDAQNVKAVAFDDVVVDVICIKVDLIGADPVQGHEPKVYHARLFGLEFLHFDFGNQDALI